jgi:ATP-binding cassette subfamily B multidrug efflux pump
VRDADLILILDDGEIAAMGTHEELLRDSELYNEILGSQVLAEPVTFAGGTLDRSPNGQED